MCKKELPASKPAPAVGGAYAVGIGSRMEPCKKRFNESRPREPSSRLSAANALDMKSGQEV